MCHLSPIIPRFVTVLRPPSDRIPSAVRSDSVRRPIRFRSASDRIAFGVRSDCVRRPIGLRSVSYRIAFGVRCWVKTKQLFLNGAHPHFMGNNKGLYATMKSWRIALDYIVMFVINYSRTSSRSSGTTMRPLKCCAASRVYVSRRVASVFSSV